MVKIMDGDKQQYNDALIAVQYAQMRGGYDNSDVDSDDQSEQLLIFSSNRDVCEFEKLLRTYKCDDGTKHGRKKEK